VLGTGGRSGAGPIGEGGARGGVRMQRPGRRVDASARKIVGSGGGIPQGHGGGRMVYWCWRLEVRDDSVGVVGKRWGRALFSFSNAHRSL
jgi:hypothetical protein